MRSTGNSKSARYEKLVNNWKHCTRCAIGKLASNHVFGKGPLDSPLLFLGEAPGKTEDETGVPFNGPAGDMLNEVLRACGIPPDAVFITNPVCCRPVQVPTNLNRVPTPSELQNCLPRLLETFRIVAPVSVVLLGKTAEYHWVTTLREDEMILATVKSHLFLYHPSYLLRTGGKKSAYYDDTVRTLGWFLRGSGITAASLPSVPIKKRKGAKK